MTISISSLIKSKADLNACGVKSLYLFGSHARGDNDDLSDVDLAGEFFHGIPDELNAELSAIHHIQVALGSYEFDFAIPSQMKPAVREMFELEKVQIF